MNGGLAVFNVLPGFPLDGGRVFRSLVWAVTGSMRQGTTVATIAGQVFAFGLIALGILILFNGSLFAGIWLVFIGWFLNGAAAASRRQVTRDEALRDIPVASLMRANPPVVHPAETMDRVVLTMLLRDGIRALPVVAEGRVVGIVTIDDARQVPQGDWFATAVRDVMSASPLIAVGPQDSILRVFDLLEEHAGHYVLVMDKNALLGVVSRGELARFFRLSRELGVDATLGRRRGVDSSRESPADR